MWVFLLIFFVVAGGVTVLNISLAETGIIRAVAVILPGAVCLLCFPLCVNLTNQSLEKVLKFGNMVSLVALVQIFESIVRIVLATWHIRKHYGESPRSWHGWLPAVPSLVFMAGLVFLMTYAFVYTSGYAFWLIAVVVAVAVVIVLWVAATISGRLLQAWGQRMEWTLLMALFQVLLAMFLPLIVKGVKVPFSQITIEIAPLAFTLALVVVAGALGALLQKYQITVSGLLKAIMSAWTGSGSKSDQSL